jgi:hypothetical protein
MDSTAIITTIAAIVKTAVDLTPTIIKGIDDARPFAEAIYHALKGDNITQDQLTELENRITDLSNQLQKELPPEEA